MHTHLPILQNRVKRVLLERVLPAQFETVCPLDCSFWSAPAEQVAGRSDGVIAEPVPFDVAIKQEYEPLEPGTAWGQAWQTVWFKVTTTIPARSEIDLGENDKLELYVDLGWFDHSAGFQSEGLVRRPDGEIIKAINPRNMWIPVPQPGETEQSLCYYIEAAANPLLLGVPPFQVTPDGDKYTASAEKIYKLHRADLVIKRHDVYELGLDLAVLREMAQTKPESDPQTWKTWVGLSQALDALDLEDVAGTAAAAREALKPLLSAPAHPGAHRLSAVGHAHIDSAWLWPIQETRRKVVRTLSNVIRLIEDGTGLIFALPAAQHLQWIKETEPELFAKIQEHVAGGAIVPVGGMWIEPDAVLPGGEAMCRQLVEGQSFFRENFGQECQEIWLPDSFGYSGALPQIAKLAGINRFLTQKISWNQVDTFPHHTLLWEGIDGSRLFTHFPPVDTYGAEVTGENLNHAVANFKDKGRANCSMLPFGYGDGGGGPTREMLGRLNRFADLAGAPRTVIESPRDFFDRAQADYPNPAVWVGELYLELHRGTFTSQINTKQGNRRSEALLRETELWCTLAAIRTDFAYPYEELRKCWRKVLLCQFHDILPGTSIAWVYREVAQIYAEVKEICEREIARAFAALGIRQISAELGESAESELLYLANATSYAQVGAPALGVAKSPAPTGKCLVDREARTIENEYLRASFASDGTCIELLHKTSGKNLIPEGQKAGELHLHQDFPNMWDAWDLDPFYQDSLQILTGGTITEISCDNQGASLSYRVEFGKSCANLRWYLGAQSQQLDLHVSLDWQETEKILKLAFPVDIHTDHAQYETQFGHIVRPTHENTSWDAYKFEVSAHRWLRLENASASCAIVNDATYGWDVRRHGKQPRGTWSQVRASLARSAQYPDPQQDKGYHEWNFAIVPQADIPQTIASAQLLNLPLRKVSGEVSPLLRLDGAVVESLSMAPDASGEVVVRCYEATGGAAQVKLHCEWAQSVWGTDLLYQQNERAVAVNQVSDTQWSFELSAFEIATLRLKPKK